jgi:hypothetical protein
MQRGVGGGDITEAFQKVDLTVRAITVADCPAG